MLWSIESKGIYFQNALNYKWLILRQQTSKKVFEFHYILLGEDFNYQDANMWYKNLDKLMKYMNETRVSLSKSIIDYVSLSILAQTKNLSKFMYES